MGQIKGSFGRTVQGQVFITTSRFTQQLAFLCYRIGIYSNMDFLFLNLFSKSVIALSMTQINIQCADARFYLCFIFLRALSFAFYTHSVFIFPGLSGLF